MKPLFLLLTLAIALGVKGQKAKDTLCLKYDGWMCDFYTGQVMIFKDSTGKEYYVRPGDSFIYYGSTCRKSNRVKRPIKIVKEFSSKEVGKP